MTNFSFSAMASRGNSKVEMGDDQERIQPNFTLRPEHRTGKGHLRLRQL